MVLIIRVKILLVLSFSCRILHKIVPVECGFYDDEGFIENFDSNFLVKPDSFHLKPHFFRVKPSHFPLKPIGTTYIIV